jgi:hypothetical protein
MNLSLSGDATSPRPAMNTTGRVPLDRSADDVGAMNCNQFTLNT